MWSFGAPEIDWLACEIGLFVGGEVSLAFVAGYLQPAEHVPHIRTAAEVPTVEQCEFDDAHTAAAVAWVVVYATKVHGALRGGHPDFNAAVDLREALFRRCREPPSLARVAHAVAPATDSRQMSNSVNGALTARLRGVLH